MQDARVWWCRGGELNSDGEMLFTACIMQSDGHQLCIYLNKFHHLKAGGTRVSVLVSVLFTPLKVFFVSKKGKHFLVSFFPCSFSHDLYLFTLLSSEFTCP